MQIEKLSFGRDINGYNAYAPNPAYYKWSATLVADTAASVTVPVNYQNWIVSFRYFPNNVWVDVTGATAEVPVSDTLTATTSEMNPSSLELESGTNISLITSQMTADVSIVMWPVNAQ